MSKGSELTFDQWLTELSRVAREKYGFTRNMADETGSECWRPHYDEGMTPEEAIIDDSFYWDRIEEGSEEA